MTELELLTEAETPPFVVEDRVNASEELRLTHRYLDLRRPEMTGTLVLRHRIVAEARRSRIVINAIGCRSLYGTGVEFFRALAYATEGSYQHINLNGYQDIALDDGATISQGRFQNLYVKPELAYTTLGDPFFPRQGARISLSAQLTPPFSALGLASADDSNPYRWLEYHKWRFSAEWYTPLLGKLVLKASTKMGWLGHYDEAIGTPDVAALGRLFGESVCMSFPEDINGMLKPEFERC